MGRRGILEAAGETEEGKREWLGMMKSAVLFALESDCKRKQKRIDALQKMMIESYLDHEDCVEWDRLAKLFNASSGDEKMQIANQMATIGKRIDAAVKKMKHQNENYQKWMTEQHKLMIDVSELQSEISKIKYYESLRKGNK